MREENRFYSGQAERKILILKEKTCAVRGAGELPPAGEKQGNVIHG